MVLASMAALCVIWRDQGGYGGLIGAAIGFIRRYAEGGQRTAGERFGNGYAGAVTGFPVGLILGVVAVYAFQHWREWAVVVERLF
jgi:hypothetical protein